MNRFYKKHRTLSRPCALYGIPRRQYTSTFTIHTCKVCYSSISMQITYYISNIQWTYVGPCFGKTPPPQFASTAQRKKMVNEFWLNRELEGCCGNPKITKTKSKIEPKFSLNNFFIILNTRWRFY